MGRLVSSDLTVSMDGYSFILDSPIHYGIMFIECSYCHESILIFIDSENVISNQEIVGDARFPGRYFLVCPHCGHENPMNSSDYSDDLFEEMRVGVCDGCGT